MVRRPLYLKDILTADENLDPAYKYFLMCIRLKRFCFLGVFLEPVKIYWPLPDVHNLYCNLNKICIDFAPYSMKSILIASTQTKTFRRDEAMLLTAVYLIGETDIKNKIEFRTFFNDIVKTDTDLFLFCKYAALVHKELGKQIFCKTIKKTITKWYAVHSPHQIADMICKNRGRNGFTHRGLIRMCRINDNTLGTSFIYEALVTESLTLVKKFEKKRKDLDERDDDGDDDDNTDGGKVLGHGPSTSAIQKTKKTTPSTSAIQKTKKPRPKTLAIQKTKKPRPSTLAIQKTGDPKPSTSKQAAKDAALTPKQTKLEPKPSTSKQAAEGAVIDNSIAIPEQQQTEYIRGLLLAISELRTTTNSATALEIIKKYQLDFEHVPPSLLRFPEILIELIPRMSYEQLIRALHGEKIRDYFSTQSIFQVCRQRFYQKKSLADENMDPIMCLMNMDTLGIKNPLKPTNNKKTRRGRLVQFSKTIFNISFSSLKPTNKKICLTLNLQQNYMKKTLKNTKHIKYNFAIATLALTFFRSAEVCDILRWSETGPEDLLHPVLFNQNCNMREAYEVLDSVVNTENKQKLILPVEKAIYKFEREISEEKEATVYDLFICIVPAATRGNKKHCSESLAAALRKYRQITNNDTKFVIIDLLRFRKSMRYSVDSCENILEICGIDENTVRLVNQFSQGYFQ